MKIIPTILIAAMMAAIPQAGCRKPGPAAETAGADHGHDHEAEALASRLTLAPEAVAAGALSFESAGVVSVRGAVAAAGDLEIDARRFVRIDARTPGRLEIVTSVPGERVRAGQILAEIYSPDYLAVQAEFVQAGDRLRRLAGTADEPSARALADAARMKLLPLGVSDADIAALEESRSLRPLLPVRAPFAGTLIESGAVPGAQVETGSPLFTLADLSSLWARVHIYEKDLASIRSGASVVLRAAAWPGENFPGRLVLVGDVMSPETRTITGRAEVPNPGGRLRPGMFAEIEIETGVVWTALAVPEAALHAIDGRTVVFVTAGTGIFDVRDVIAGRRADGFVEILDGLREGDSVAARGSILLKSELLKATLVDEHDHD